MPAKNLALTLQYGGEWLINPPEGVERPNLGGPAQKSTEIIQDSEEEAASNEEEQPETAAKKKASAGGGGSAGVRKSGRSKASVNYTQKTTPVSRKKKPTSGGQKFPEPFSKPFKTAKVQGNWRETWIDKPKADVSIEFFFWRYSMNNRVFVITFRSLFFRRITQNGRPRTM